MPRGYESVTRRPRYLSSDLDEYSLRAAVRSIQSSQSPVRDEPTLNDYFYDFYDPDQALKSKWLDNSPRMSRMRENRQKRLINKLEQFELWDMEQEQKQKQYELAREQRYKNIMERLKSQEFCVSQMKKRHESDLEASRDLETYTNEHFYVDALDDAKKDVKGPVTQYRKFQSEMDNKLKTLEHDIQTLNPRNRIELAILPRIERTREKYSVEPEVFTRSGRRVLKRPNLKSYESAGTETDKLLARVEQSFREPTRRLRNLFVDADRPKPRPIIHIDDSSKTLASLSKKTVNFNEEIEAN
ncbi:hypothetical protein BpHYR1_039328 [Brachionus plicatilis]|uniref:Uncharacterized protein n=1 Tax=Brachionus plicatilis TaxID=10195 RepID=A0A3M7SUK9_BRAPC|nr:hypothetical protein BpHYR1_039328 [Brachionus plicatilis]